MFLAHECGAEGLLKIRAFFFISGNFPVYSNEYEIGDVDIRKRDEDKLQTRECK